MHRGLGALPALIAISCVATSSIREADALTGPQGFRANTAFLAAPAASRDSGGLGARSASACFRRYGSWINGDGIVHAGRDFLSPYESLGTGRTRCRSPLSAARMLASKGGKTRKQKKLNFDLDSYMKKHQDMHDSECEKMQGSFDATLKSGQTRSDFSYDDFQHVEFAKDIIGDRNNFPFDSKDLVHYTKTPLFSREDCNAVIEEAEEYAAARGGWATQRHYSHPTTDILLEELPRSLEWFKGEMTSKLFPMMSACFPTVIEDPERLRIFDVFVVKYDAFEQSYLSVHRDSSLISVTIALNSKEEFDGGGMFLEPTDSVLELDQGHAVTFASNVRHGGNKVTKGLRYILVGFLLYEGYCEHDRRLLQASQVCRKQGDNVLAERLCREALALNPNRQEAWNNLGCLQRDSGDFDAGMKSFERSLGIQDRYQEGWVNMGVCQAMSGDMPGAMETALHAVDLNGRDATAHYNLGCSYAEDGNDATAMAEFDEVIVLNARDGDAYHRRGQLKIKGGDLSGAIADFECASTFLPDSCGVQNDIGVAKYEADDMEGALAAFDRALVIDPTDIQAKENAISLRNFLSP